MSRRFFYLVSKFSIVGSFKLRNGASLEVSGFRSKLIAASILLLASSPKLTEVRAYAQSYNPPASIVTVPQNVDLGASNSVQGLATVGSSITQGIVVTTGDKLPGASTDSQGGTGHQGPAVPPAPGMPSVDAVGGLIPSVPGVTLTPEVPVLTTNHSLATLTPSAATTPTANPDGASATNSTQAALPDAASPSVTGPQATPASVNATAPASASASASPSLSPSTVPAAVTTTAPDTATSSALAVQPVQLTLGSSAVYGSGLGLDLSSTQATIAAPISQPVTITVGGSMNVSGSVVGGTALTIHPGQLLTPSQYVALTQVVGQGNQSIVLTDSGVSQSGSLTLLANQTGALSSLVLPTNVVLSGVGFSASNPFVVSGSTSILGSFFALQNSSSTASILNFGNLTVSGLLTANAAALPTVSLGSAANGSSLFSSSGLTINTVGFLNNSGVISSPAFLNINAGGSFTNTGTVLASTGNLAVNSFSGNFVNSGMLSAPSGSININTAAATLASNINFNNLSGKLSAQDDINFRSAGNTSSADINISGGDLLSSQLNINAGLGNAEVHVDQLTGVLNSYGSAAHVSANTSTLTLGEQCLVGDPTYFNSGNIAIAGNITVGEKLAVIASGNITNSGAGGYAVTARNGSGVGQDITMIAGAAFTTSGAGAGVAAVSGAPPAGAIPLGGTINVTGGSATGGNITLTTGAGVSLIDASGTAGAGGNVTLIAFSNAAGSANGTIALPTTSNINSSGSAGNANGNIAIGAGRSSGAAAVGIQLGSLTASGGATTTGGNITVALAQPTVSVGGVTYDSTGAISNGGSFAFPVATGTTDQRIQIGAGASQSLKSGGNVNLSAGGAVTLNVGAITTQGGSFTATSNAFGESISLNAGSFSTSGGNVVLSAGDTLTLASGSLNTSPTAGNGGSITLLSDQDGDGVGNITAPTFTFTTNAVGVGSAGNFFAEDRANASSGKQISLGNLSLTGTTGGNAVIHGNGANLTLAAITASSGGSIKILASPSTAALPPTQTIQLNGSINTGGSSLAVVTSGNIASGAGIAINTNGGSAFFASGASGSLETASSPTSNIIVSGRSGVGGNIDFATNAITGFNTAGGEVNMAASAATAGGTTNGRILLPVAVPITTAGGNVQLVAEQTNAAGNSIQILGGIDTTGGVGVGNINVSTATPVLPVTFISANGALTSSLVGGATRAAAVNLGSLNAKSSSVTTVNVSRVDAASSINGNVGTLNVSAQSGLLRVGALTTSGVTSIVNGPGGDITTIGNVVNTSGGITLQTSGMAANGGIITINGAVSKSGAGDLSLITTGAGTASNIVINQAVSESGSGNLVIQTSGANSDITVNNAVSSDLGSITTLTSGSSGTASIDLLAGATVNGHNLTLTTPALTVAAAASLTGVSGDLQVSSNLASGALTVALGGPTSTVQSTTGNVNFNRAALPGAITLTGGAANGIVSANGGTGSINLNGGTNAVAVNANQLKGVVTGTGSTFTVSSGLVGSALNTGAIAATGNIALTSAGNVLIASDITTSGGNLGVTSGTSAANQISLLANADLLASNNVTLTTPNLLLTGGSNTVTATGGDVSLQSNTAGNALAVTLGSGAQINAATVGTGDIFFNPTTAGSITVTGGAANGLLNAGNTVSFRGGAVVANVNQINGRVVSNGTNTTASITTATGDLRVGAYTSSGLTSFTANGVGADIITTGTISSGAGNLTLQAGIGADANVAINNAVTSTGTLTVTSGAGSNSKVTVANAITASGGITNIRTPTLVLGTSSRVQATAGVLDVSSNVAGNSLTVTLGSGSVLASTTNNLSFNGAGSGAITMNSGLGTLQAGGATPLVLLNGGLGVGAVDVSVNNVIGTVRGTGLTVSVVAQSGDLAVGPITSRGPTLLRTNGVGADVIVRGAIDSGAGNLTLQAGSGANANVTVNSTVTTMGNLNVVAGNLAGSNVTVATAASLSGGTTTITTPSLVVNGTGSVSSNNDLQISSNLASRALTVALGGPTSTVQSTTGNVNFNSVALPGAITLTGGAANGIVSANGGVHSINLNGGTNAVAVNARQLNGTVAGTGSTFTVNSGLVGSLLNTGAIAATGNVVLTSAGNVLIASDITTSGGNLGVTSGTSAANQISLLANADLLASNNVTLTTPNLLLTGGSNTVTATGGDVALQSNTAGNALAVTLGSGAQINAATVGTGDIFFNPTTAGSITVTGGAANGLLNAGNTVSFRGGAVAANVNQINGRVVSNGTNTTASITTATGDLRVGGYTSSGLTSFTANGVGADIITTGTISSGAGSLTLQAGSGANANVAINNAVTSTGTLTIRSSSDPTSNVTIANAVNLSGGSTNITTPNLVVNGTGAVLASTGNLQISSNAPANALSVALNGANSLLRATVGNLSFNTLGAPGSIAISGGPLNGVLTANNGLGNVNFNGGLSNPVNVNVRQINGTITGTGTPFNVSVAQASVLGDLRLGPITSNGDLIFTSPANIIVRDDLTANSGNISLTSGTVAANSVSFSANADLLASGNITLTTPNLLLTGGNNTITATNGDVAIQSNRAGAALQVTMGVGSQINAATVGAGDIFFNPSTAGNVSVTGGAANGLLNAGNTVSFRGGTVAANVKQINGAVVSNGATVTTAAVTTANGDLRIGPFTSSGLTSFAANGAGANLISSGAINSGAGNLTLRSGSGVSDVRINNNVTTTGLLSVVAGVAAGSDVTLASAAVVSGGSTTINTPALNLGANSQLKATTAALTIDSNAAGNGLGVTMAANSSLVGATNVTFNTAGAANQGPITISGASGSLVQAPAINYNVGPNSLNVNLGQLAGNNNILSAVGNPTAVGIVSQSGAINFTTAINTSNTAGNGGNINVVANGGSVGLGGFDVSANGGGALGSGGSINISGSTGIVNGGNIRSNGSAVGAGNGGAISLSSNANIRVNTLQSFGGATGNGGSITSNSANLSVVGIGPGGNSISTFATNGNGGVVSVNTTSNNPFIVGSPIPNGTASGIASNGFNNGGLVTIASNGATVNSPVSANGGTGSGGVVTLVANNPATNPVFNVNSPISAIGGIPNTGVIGIGSGPYQPLTLNVGAGSINAGQQLTIGNLNTVTGLPAGLPSGLLTITPTPSAVLPAAPFNTPAIVYNGNSLGPPPLPAVTTNPLASNNFDFAFFLLNQGAQQNAELGLRIPTDLTPVFDQEQLSVDISQENEELVRKASVGSRVLIDGQTTYKSSMSKEDIAKLAAEGIVLLGDTSGNSFGLEQGNMVFAPAQDIVVHAGESTIIVPAGAVVFVMKTADDVAVFDLHQSKESAVHIVADKKLITLDPGRLVVLTKQSARDFERTVGPYRWIGYRNPREEDINSELKAFGMDFSIPSALTNVIPLKNMLSSDNRLDRVTIEKVLKNSALLGELTNGAGPFRSGSDLSQ